jgi:hypothetical protein
VCEAVDYTMGQRDHEHGRKKGVVCLKTVETRPFSKTD